MRHALIDTTSNMVVNVVVIDVSAESLLPEELRSTPTEGYVLVPSDSAGIGDSWDGENIIPANQPMGPK